MRSRSNWMLRRMGAIAAVIGISALGDVRLHASEVNRPKTLVEVVPVGHTEIFARTGLTQSPMFDDDSSPADEATIGDGAMEGHFVPAIYAWDPDVRFVYYRHISKWM